MPREFTRPELVSALSIVARFLESFPASLTLADDDAPEEPARLRDGMVAPPTSALPGDGRRVSRHTAQPPRKLYAAAPRAKRDAIDWAGVPRAARRVAEIVMQHAEPLTSHAIMESLGIARSTLDNAASELQRRGILVTRDIRDDHSRRPRA